MGKSSLIDLLLPDETLRIGALSEDSRKGTHTTTTARLYAMRSDEVSNGELIDSPGIREFGLQHVDAQLVAPGFREFTPYLNDCRFRDCSHLVEQHHCGVLAALDRGDISPDRYDSFVNIVSNVSSSPY